MYTAAYVFVERIVLVRSEQCGIKDFILVLCDVLWSVWDSVPVVSKV